LLLGLSALALVAATGISLTIGNVAAQSTRRYAGLQTRSIKALSAEQIADLNAGRGMSLALAAELNGYPGPRHVLELGAQLGLTDQQRVDVQRLVDQMIAEVVPIGEKLVSQEAELDRLFAHRVVTLSGLDSATAAIEVTQGELRKAHLKYHLIPHSSRTTNRSGALQGGPPRGGPQKGEPICCQAGGHRSSSAVATSREDHHSPRSGRGGLHRRRGRERDLPTNW
jgi:hypothetical protein